MFGQIFRRFEKWMENLNIFGWIVWSGSWTCQKSFPSLHQILFKYGWSRFYFETIEVFTFKNLAFFYCNFCIFIAKNTNQLLNFLFRKKGQFVEALDELEANPECRSLKFQSFLVLPMQRITRLPLLIGAILKRLEPNSPKYQVCEEALEIVKKVWVTYKCNFQFN